MTNKIIQVTIDDHVYDVSTCYRIESNDLVIFLHGLGCSKGNFKQVFIHPEYKNISLLTIDLIGFGDSCKPDDFSYTMEDQARVCGAVINSFRDYNLHIAAHSMAGVIGLLLSDDIIERMKSFANLEGNLVGDDCFISREVMNITFEEFKDSFFHGFKKSLGNDAEQLNNLKRSSLLAFYKSCQSLVSWSGSGKILEKFKSLKNRKAYFYGEFNSGISVLKLLNNIPVIKISKSGHFMMMDNADEFYTKLIKFQSPGAI